jgi:hypothetical protein
MTQLEHDFMPGNLVRARGREWVVQSESRRDWLRLRPLGGADDEIIALIPELELQPVEPATFHGHSLSKQAITLLRYCCVMPCVSNCVLVAAHFVLLAT